MNSDALKYALNYLKEPHTTSEVTNKLIKKKIDENDIKDIIDYLTEKGYLDDETYTKAYFDYHLFEKGESKRAIKYKLLKKGIGKDMINKISENIIEYDETEIIVQRIMQKFKNEDINDTAVQLKIKKYMYSKGFSYEAINNAIKKLI